MSTDPVPSGDRGPTLPSTASAAVVGLKVADVMRAGTKSLPRGVTVGELRDWFAVSVSRRLAVLPMTGATPHH